MEWNWERKDLPEKVEPTLPDMFSNLPDNGVELDPMHYFMSLFTGMFFFSTSNYIILLLNL